MERPFARVAPALHEGRQMFTRASSRILIVLVSLASTTLKAERAASAVPGQGRPGPGGVRPTDPWCAILDAQDQPHPAACRPLQCEQCPANAWMVACVSAEAFATGLGSEPLVIWGSILSFVADHATDFLCGPGSSFSSYTFWMHNTCDTLGQNDPDCQAAKLVHTCVCMGHAGARGTYRGQMGQYCDKCACWRRRTYSTVAEQVNAAKACLNQSRPRPGGGRAYGDPNLVTLDGAYASDHRAGEFIGMRKRAGLTGPDLEIQFRYQPWGGSNSVSMVTGLAVRYQNNRINLYARPSAELRIDGAVTAVPADGLFIASGVEVWQDGGYYAIYLPNGDIVTANMLGDFMNVSVELTEDLRNKTEGVLGDFDGNPANDPTTFASGTFRITTQAASLFDYRTAGESLATFNDTSFPGNPFNPATVPADLRTAAEQTCALARVSDPAVREGCIRDQIVTSGDPRILTASTEMQAELAFSVSVSLP